jgi:hypothetical protein
MFRGVVVLSQGGRMNEDFVSSRADSFGVMILSDVNVNVKCWAGAEVPPSKQCRCLRQAAAAVTRLEQPRTSGQTVRCDGKRSNALDGGAEDRIDNGCRDADHGDFAAARSGRGRIPYYWYIFANFSMAAYRVSFLCFLLNRPTYRKPSAMRFGGRSASVHNGAPLCIMDRPSLLNIQLKGTHV